MQKNVAKKGLFLGALSVLAGVSGLTGGLTPMQALILSIFCLSIVGTLFFWHFRLSFVFVGSGVMVLMGAVDMETFIRFASLDVILFLIAMMIIVGMMKDAGLFEWLITLILRQERLSGPRMFVTIIVASAVLSSLMGEVASIVVIMALVLNICDFLDMDPLPLAIASVMATNIGSAATVLGNPVGVLIAARGHLSFEDFLTHSAPLTLAVLAAVIVFMLFWYRKYLQKFSDCLMPFHEDKNFLYLISVPPDRRTRVSMAIFGVTIVLIALHRRLEEMLGLEHNTMLIMLPIISAGLVMLYRHDRARHYIENEVEWPSLLFFMFLFAQAGVIQASGIAGKMAQNILNLAGDSPAALSGIILFSGGLLSSGLDNVVTVASFIPVVLSLSAFDVNLNPLWWALLFGACFGGNVTMIGSTANIVALGILEKERNIRVTFLQWLKFGLAVSVISMVMAYLAILLIPMYLH